MEPVHIKSDSMYGFDRMHANESSGNPAYLATKDDVGRDWTPHFQLPSNGIHEEYEAVWSTEDRKIKILKFCVGARWPLFGHGFELNQIIFRNVTDSFLRRPSLRYSSEIIFSR